jgi:manganese transport protein
MKNFFSKLGPAIIAIGFTIGTGSVTSLIVAGSRYGVDLLWVILLSCLFSYACIEAYGRYFLATGETALYAFKKHLPMGKWISILIIVGLTFGQWNSLMGNLTITSNAIFETINLFFPSLGAHAYAYVLGIAILNVFVMYLILNTGKFHLFERVLTLFVSLMAFCFLVSLFIVMPDMGDVVKGFVPKIPDVEGADRLMVAFVGTTMAAATFLSRPLFIQAKGWGKKDSKMQSNDALVACILIFVISATIMVISMSTLFKDGKTVTKVLDMVGTLEPVAGKFALAIFLVGVLSAGLSSIFPILMITPILIADYQSGKLDMKSKSFKIITAIAAVVGLIGPAFGGNPIELQIFTQVFLVLVLPMVILAILILVNKAELMGELKAGWLLNTGLVLAFIFSVLITSYGVIDIKGAIERFLG